MSAGIWKTRRSRWRLTMTGSADGRIAFSVHGHAVRKTETNRVGLCVHLPLAGFAGARYRLQTGRGRPQSLRLPRDVAPHQPCTDIRSLRLSLARGRVLEIALYGDEFELEDQRNWIDGSFKLYSRPLARGYPYTLAADPPVWDEYRAVIRKSGLSLSLEPIDKWDFYKAVETPDHVLTVQTADCQRFANLLLSIGVRMD